MMDHMRVLPVVIPLVYDAPSQEMHRTTMDVHGTCTFLVLVPSTRVVTVHNTMREMVLDAFRALVRMLCSSHTQHVMSKRVSYQGIRSATIRQPASPVDRQSTTCAKSPLDSQAMQV